MRRDSLLIVVVMVALCAVVVMVVALAGRRCRTVHPGHADATVRRAYGRCGSAAMLMGVRAGVPNVLDRKHINPHVHPKRIAYVSSLLDETLRRHAVPDMLFIVALTDTPPDLGVRLLGSISQAGKPWGAIPINWWSYFGEVFEPGRFDATVAAYQSAAREPAGKVVFRGSNNCETRRHLKRLADAHPEIADVALPNGRDDPDYIDGADLRRRYGKFFVVRGRGAWTGSLNQFALAGGVLFVVQEGPRQPLDSVLVPGIDYVAIRANLSDFAAQLDKAHDASLMRAMRDRLHEKAARFFTAENVMRYTRDRLLEVGG